MDEVASVSRQLSLLLVGFIILSSVRLILERVGRVLKVSSRTLSAAFLLLLLAQLMVCPSVFESRPSSVILTSTGVLRPIHNCANPHVISTHGLVSREQPLCDSPGVPDVWCIVRWFISCSSLSHRGVFLGTSSFERRSNVLVVYG